LRYGNLFWFPAFKAGRVLARDNKAAKRTCAGISLPFICRKAQTPAKRYALCDLCFFPLLSSLPTPMLNAFGCLRRTLLLNAQAALEGLAGGGSSRTLRCLRGRGARCSQNRMALWRLPAIPVRLRCTWPGGACAAFSGALNSFRLYLLRSSMTAFLSALHLTALSAFSLPLYLLPSSASTYSLHKHAAALRATWQGPLYKVLRAERRRRGVLLL